MMQVYRCPDCGSCVLDVKFNKRFFKYSVSMVCNACGNEVTSDTSYTNPNDALEAMHRDRVIQSVFKHSVRNYDPFGNILV